MPRASYRYRKESKEEELDRRFFILEGRFAEMGDSLGELWCLVMQQQKELKQLHKGARKATQWRRKSRGSKK